MARWERLYHARLARHFATRLYWPRLAGSGVETRGRMGVSVVPELSSPGENLIRER